MDAHFVEVPATPFLPRTYRFSSCSPENFAIIKPCIPRPVWPTQAFAAHRAAVAAACGCDDDRTDLHDKEFPCHLLALNLQSAAHTAG